MSGGLRNRADRDECQEGKRRAQLRGPGRSQCIDHSRFLFARCPPSCERGGHLVDSLAPKPPADPTVDYKQL